MNKKVYLVHCWEGTSNDGWYPWIDNELEKCGVSVFRFDMPNTERPNIEEWVSFLEQKVDCLDENTYFIGHSIGCQTIMRYLEMKDVRKIGGILFVAPWLDLLPYAIEDRESYDIAYPWIHTPIDFEKIRRKTENIYSIFSDDDYFVSLEQEALFKERLGAETIVVSKKGHISAEDDVFDLPEILDFSQQMLGLDIYLQDK